MRKNKYYLLTLSLALILILGLIVGCSSTSTTPPATTSSKPAATTSQPPAATTTTAATSAKPSTTAPATTSAATTAAGKVFNLKFQGKWVGMEKQRWTQAQLQLADKVKAATNGRIIITNVNELFSDAAVIDGVRTGGVDIAVQGLHLRGETALQNFISLPYVPFDKLYDLMNQAESITLPAWDKLDVKGLGYNVYLPQFVFTSKPCDTFDTLKAMKLRITGSILNDMVSKAGGHPLTMEADAVYQAIQRNTIDGSQSALPGFFNYAWYEVAKYMSEWPMGCNGLGIVMNKQVWNDLGPELQAKLMETIAQEEKDQFEGAKLDIADLVKQASDKGVTRKDPSQAEKDKLLAFAGTAQTNWKSKVDAKGADQIMEIINKTLGSKY